MLPVGNEGGESLPPPFPWSIYFRNLGFVSYFYIPLKRMQIFLRAKPLARNVSLKDLRTISFRMYLGKTAPLSPGFHGAAGT